MPYVVVMDCGSTGSRIYLYHRDSGNGAGPDGGGGSSRGRLVEVTEASYKLTPGLSSFHEEDAEAAASQGGGYPAQSNLRTAISEYLTPAFAHVVQFIPEGERGSTRVRIMATAGMRLLPLKTQRVIYGHVFEGVLNDASFPMTVNAGDPVLFEEVVRTIPGDEEGYFAALASNYLGGVIDLKLKPSGLRLPLQGALDLGGSSTQVVIPRRRGAPGDGGGTSVPPSPPPPGGNTAGALNADAFWIHSYLGFGADKICERLLGHLIESGEAEMARLASQLRDGSLTEGEHGVLMADAAVVENPCAFVGHRATDGASAGIRMPGSGSGYDGEVGGGGGVTLVGTGDAPGCAALLRTLLFGEANALSCTDNRREVWTSDAPRPINFPNCDVKEPSATVAMSDVVSVPDIPSGDGGQPVDFLAMSMYFYATHAMDLALDWSFGARGSPIRAEWPSPSVASLALASEQFCAMDIDQVMAFVESGVDEFTDSGHAPMRCLEAVYIVTLLRDAYRFPETSRSVHFSLEVAGTEVEWTLGAALDLVASSSSPGHLRGDGGNSTPGYVTVSDGNIFFVLFLGAIALFYRGWRRRHRTADLDNPFAHLQTREHTPPSPSKSRRAPSSGALNNSPSRAGRI